MTTDQPIVICGVREARCECVEPAGHWPASPHRCDPGCGGAWTFDESGEFVTVSWPKGTGEGRQAGPFVSARDLLFAVPWTWSRSSLCGGPIRAPRGAIRYLLPPAVEPPEATDGDNS